MIRKNDADACPFGLPIINACENAGKLVEKMTSIEAIDHEEEKSSFDKEQIKQSNLRLFIWHNPGQRCKYAGQLIPQKQAVECNWEDTDPGAREKATLVGSPAYSKLFEQIGLDGLLSWPLGMYNDFDTSRNMYYGLSSNNSNKIDISLIKIADEIIKLKIGDSKKFMK